MYFEQRVNDPDIINIKKGEEAIIFFIINGYFPWWINDQSEFNSIFKEFDLGEPFSRILLILYLKIKKGIQDYHI